MKKISNFSKNRLTNALSTIAKLTFVSLFLFAIFYGCSGKKDLIPGAIPFEYTKSYPKIDLMLEDIFDVSYIPIETDSSTIVGDIRSQKGRNAHLSLSGLIYLKDDVNNMIRVIDEKGRQVRSIHRHGNGPGEYTVIADFFVDEEQDELFIYDFTKIEVYNLNGDHKRTLRPEFRGYAPEIHPLTDSIFIILKSSTKAPVELYSRNDGRLISTVPIIFDDYVLDKEGVMGHGTMSASSQGVSISSFRSDVIYIVDREGQEHPIIQDVSDYPSDKVQLHLVMDNDQFALCMLMSYPTYTPQIKIKYYLLDKKEKQFYLLPDDINNPDQWSILNGYCEITHRIITQDYRTAIYITSPTSLIYNHEKGNIVFEPLKKIVSNLKDDDNSVIIVLKMKTDISLGNHKL